MPDLQSTHLTYKRMVGKRTRRHSVIVPSLNKKATAHVRSVVDPTLDWQKIGNGYEMKLDATSQVISIRDENTKELVMYCPRSVLENLMRMLPKKVR